MSCLLALIVALVAWALTSGGGGGSGKGAGAPSGSHTPVTTITPGPTPTGTHIGGRPGGRDTSGGADSTGGTGTTGGSSNGSSAGTAGATSGASSSPSASGGTSDGGSAGAGGSSGADGGSGSGGSSGGSSGGGSGDGSSTGGQVPVGSSLPDCSPSAVQLTLTSAQNSYGPSDTPQFRLTAANSSSVSCKLDFGPRSAVFTVTKATDNSHVWASDDCPATGSHLMEVPAHGSTTYTLHWNGKTSSPKCASPKGRTAQPGTYLVQAQVPGHGAEQASFVLSQD